MQLLVEYLDDPRFERVVVDTAPTGHTLRLLELPELMNSMLGRLLSMRESLSGAMGAANPFGGEADADTAGLDELSTRIERLRDALEDPSRTDFRVVMVPEEMSVTESERLVGRLEEFGIPVRTVVVNRVSEDLASVADLDTDWFVAPDTEGCEFCRRRWEVQRDALTRAQELFRGTGRETGSALRRGGARGGDARGRRAVFGVNARPAVAGVGYAGSTRTRRSLTFVPVGPVRRSRPFDPRNP